MSTGIEKDRKRPTKRLLWAVGLFLAALAVMVLATRWMGGSRLERYRQRLLAQGEVLDWHSAMTNTTVSDGQQSKQLVVLAGGLNQGSEVSKGVYPEFEFPAPGVALVPWKRPLDWERFRQEMTDHREALIALRALLQDPDVAASRSSYSPATYISGAAPFVQKREAAYWLWRAHVLALEQGDLQGAREEIQALLGLARLQEHDRFLVDHMIRVAIARIAAQASWSALQVEGWDEAVLISLADTWRKVPVLEGMNSSITMERAMGVWFFNLYRTNAPGANTFIGLSRPSSGLDLDALFVEPVWRFTYMDEDELNYLRHFQVFIEAVRIGVQDRSLEKAEAHLQGTPVESTSSLVPSEFRHRYSAMLVPNWTKALRVVLQVETEKQMILVVTAIRRHILKTGQPPASLEALVPDYLEAVPIDGMDGRPLRYILRADGTWRLYSVGTDFIDDGGDPSWISDPGEGSMWWGRDAVWPDAAFQ